MSIGNFNNKTFNLLRENSTPSPLGDVLWYKVSEIEGFFQQTSGKETFLKQQQFENTALIGFLDIDTDIAVGDRLQDDKNCYRVTNVMDAGGIGHHIEVYLELSTEYIQYPTPLE